MHAHPRSHNQPQLEEDLGDDYRWSYRVNRVLFSGKSEYQEVDLVDTPTWGKVRGWNVCGCSTPIFPAQCCSLQLLL